MPTLCTGCCRTRRSCTFWSRPTPGGRRRIFWCGRGFARRPKILAVETRAGTFAGYVIWHPYGRDAWELGRVLCRDAWHKGYARELTEAFIEEARGRTRTLVLECVPAQQATRAIALQNHFVYAGREDGCHIYKLRLD